jgi:hypothetical protein
MSEIVGSYPIVSYQIVLDFGIKGHCVQVPAWAGDSLIPRDGGDVWPIDGGGTILLLKQTVERLASISVNAGPPCWSLLTCGTALICWRKS